MGWLLKLFTGPALKFLIGGVLIAGAYFGTKAALSWFESRVVEHERVVQELAVLKAQNAFLEAEREKARQATTELDTALRNARNLLSRYQNEPSTPEIDDWRAGPSPVNDRLRRLARDPDRVSGSDDPAEPDPD